MNGVRQERLIKTIAKLRARCCSYIGPRCDCKFATDTTSDDSIMSGSESGSGCPELMQVAYMFAQLTEQEYLALAKRAGINVEDPFKPAVDVGAILREEKEKRDAGFIRAKPPTTPKSLPPRNKKNPYDLSTSRKTIHKIMKNK